MSAPAPALAETEDPDGHAAPPLRPAEDLTWIHRPTRELVRLAWPITVSTLSFVSMSLVSTALVATLGAPALAGVGLAGVVAFAMVCFGLGLLRGAKSLVAQALGAGRHDRLAELLAGALVLAGVLGTGSMVLGEALAPLVARACGSIEAGVAAEAYFRLRIATAPLLLAQTALREASYGRGETRAPMRAALAGNLTNVAIAAPAILWLGGGVVVAGLATIAGNLVELLVLAWPARAQLRRLPWRRAQVAAVWREGVPNGLQFTMEVGAFLILTTLIARMSAAEAGAHQLVMGLVNVSFLPAHALAEATSVLVGQAVGAGRTEQVVRLAGRALGLGALYAAACSMLYAVIGGQVVGALAGGDHALAQASTTLLHVSLVFLVADAANVIARGALRGASDVRYAAWVGIVTSWLTTPPLAWLLGFHFGLGAAGGWLGLAAEIIVGAALFWRRVVRGGWRPSAVAARARAAAGASASC